MIQLLTYVAVFAIGQADKVAPSEVWPQWRGPTADSVAPTKQLPLKWDAATNVVWKAALPGWATSTPAIWKDAIFVTAQREESLVLLRLDRATGKVLWEKEVSRGTPGRKGPPGVGRFHDEHNMASPSPVTDGVHVWVHFGTGVLACYTFDGTQVWSENLTKAFGPYSIWWGHANSPLLVDDLLISACMQDPKGGGKSYVVAHEKLTGKERWRALRDTGATSEPADSYTTPLLLKDDGKTQVAIYGGNVLNAYDAPTGKEVWECKAFKGNRVISGPTLVGDTIYAIQGMKGPLFAIKTGGSGDVTKSHVQWKYAGGTPDSSCPVFVNGLVFMGNNSGTVICVDAATGQELWKERLADAYRATPLVVDDKVFFFSKEGKVSIVAASRKLNVLAENQLGEEITSSPAVAHNDLYLRSKKHLYRIGSSK